MIETKHFAAHELVPPKIFNVWGDRSFMFIDDRLLKLIDALREEFGSATINNWKWGKDRQWSGLRTSDSPYYSPTSQHSFGRAADIIFRDVPAEEAREHLKLYPNKFTKAAECKFITIEEGVSWLHVDVRNGKEFGLNSFRP